MTKPYEFPLDQAQVKTLIPHRDPMLFVDRIMSQQGDQIEIESDTHPDDPHFAGHFPTSPILPGVLIIETVAQAGAILVEMLGEVEEGKFLAFSGVDSAKFKKPVYPNETILVEVEIVKRRGPFYKFSGRVSRDGKSVAAVDFSAAKMDF